MKKVVSLLFIICIVFSFFCMTVSAEGDGTVEGGYFVVSEGQEVYFPVKYTGHSGVSVIRIFVDYDTEKLEYIGVKRTAEDKLKYSDTNKNGRITLLLDTIELKNLTEDVTLFEVVFKVKENSPVGTAKISLSGDASKFTDNNTKVAEVKPAFISGYIEIVCKEHNFENLGDGTQKCKICNLLKEGETVKVPVTEDNGNVAGTIIKDETETRFEENRSQTQITEPNKNEDTDDDENKTGFFVPLVSAVIIAVVIIAAVIIAVGIIITVVFINKNKKGA